ncbi:hypothetical protein JX265_010917 [Neoarthrinium moseri]|uniref:Glucose-methanol-choline oxidoreductase N-terminal domain-containing protein n=1 Tax=Neoarthrinium moseri TaxID=1658444 RepID=A0A9P9WDU8_9PEZI|nr:uncharacterized protein JN550_008971 [Neoarthrinium moseri]KAI1846333.1 hypothetical protein JX266_007538 [Neoarthrinium moseri]KAI1858249.1 hypothetical protein JX265_010917 [Neoarthrinium moseri]KAI1864414.1 hypothetical protein JN550_008971 [Neoarthrinium moseri]
MGFTQRLAAGAVLAQAAAALVMPSHNPFITKRSSYDHEFHSDATTEYDFVCIGSGPGGGHMCSNLAIAGFKVLIIEAGGDEGMHLIQQVPAMNIASTEHWGMEWAYYIHKYEDTEIDLRDSKMVYNTKDGKKWTSYNQTGNLGTPATSGSIPDGAEPLGIYYPRTGALGGCSRHNALFSMQPYEMDWDDMAELTGDASYNSSNMRQYLTRITDVSYLPHAADSGSSGWYPLQVTSLLTAATDIKIVSVLAAAATAFGKTILTEVVDTATYLAKVLLSDINAPGQTMVPQVYQVPLVMREDSHRGGVYDLIVDTALATWPNGTRKYHLDIMLDTLATKLTFDTSGDKPRATGVEYMMGQSLYRADPRSGSAEPTDTGHVSVTKEVIVAGGAYNTPQILKLSGVGPRAELEKLGIDVVLDLPGVGTNLQDRYEQTMVSKTETPFALTADCTWHPDPELDPCMKKFVEGNDQVSRGGYASNGIAVAVIRNSTTSARGEPDIMLLGGPANFTGYYSGWSQGCTADAQHWAWIILKSHQRNNYGTVELASADPRDMPIINFRKFYNDEEAALDLTAIREAYDYARSIMKDVIPIGGLLSGTDGSLLTGVDEIFEGAFTEVWPGADVQGDDLDQFIRDESWGHHASCSAPIGADGDPMAVLDGDLRVRGIDGLRVSDLSACNKLPGYFPILWIHQLVEKVADTIVAEYSS